MYPFLKYDITKNMFECAFCPQITNARQHLLKHLNRFHVSEIKSEIEENGERNTETKYDCIIRKCRLMYGRQHQLWCKMCSETNVHNSTSNVAKENQGNPFFGPLKNEDLLPGVNFNSEMENDSKLYEEISNDQSNLSENVDNETAIQAYLFQYCWYNTDKNMIECNFCKYSKPSSRRSDFFVHIRNKHKTEIHESDLPPEQIEDCETKICRKLYGFNHQQLWCKECVLNPPKTNAKGQIISECLIDVFKFSKKPTNNLTNFCPRI